MLQTRTEELQNNETTDADNYAAFDKNTRVCVLRTKWISSLKNNCITSNDFKNVINWSFRRDWCKNLHLNDEEQPGSAYGSEQKIHHKTLFTRTIPDERKNAEKRVKVGWQIRSKKFYTNENKKDVYKWRHSHQDFEILLCVSGILTSLTWFGDMV